MSSAITSTDSLACVEEDIARAKEEIHQRIVSLANLYAKKNSFLPVFSLPPEILEIIFIHGACDHYESCDGDCVTSCIPTWVNVSYVCSHWRSIALNCPTLWTYHFDLTRRWSEELLLRSKEASLKISYARKISLWRSKTGAWSRGLDSLLQHIERIQELRLNAVIFPAYFSLRAPRLEFLEIKCREQLSGCLAIVDADTPVLRTLKLSRCLLPWSLFNLSGLKTLSLSDVAFPSNIEFLTVLGSMQDLTVLHLKHTLRGPLLDDDLDFPQINLPRLELLVVSAPLPEVLAFLSNVNIPSKARLSMELERYYDASAEDCARFCSLLSHRFTMAEQSGTIMRSLTMDNDDLLTLAFSSLERDCRPPLPKVLDDDIPLQITFHRAFFGIELNDIEPFSLMADICSSLPLANVQTLCLYSPEWSSEIWEAIFGCLDGLRYLKLSNGLMPDLSMLSERADGERCVLVPALEEVELVDMCFSPDDRAMDDRVSEKSFLDVLSTREGLRDRVTMVCCSVFPSE